MQIRPEQNNDHDSIREIIRAAFATHAHSLHNEERIVDALRTAGALTLSLVAVDRQEVIGYVACSRVTIDDRPSNWHGLGPIAVRPDKQNAHVGSALMRASIEHLKDSGADGIVLLGDPAYYQRFGFKACGELSLPGVPPSHFMCLPLRGEAPAGTVGYHSAFQVG